MRPERAALALFVAGLAALPLPSRAADEGSLRLADGTGRERVQAACSMCHSLDYILMNSPFQDRAAWQKTVDKYGSIDLVSTRIASLCKGKYAADDAFRLGAFDSTAGDSGDWVAVTPIKDASGGKCTKVKS